ncbi:MAG: DUF1501 domain-containing protein [Gemmataceae bacterium]
MNKILSTANRRTFLRSTGLGFGGLALSSMLARESRADSQWKGVLEKPHFAPKAKRVIYLFMAGGPSQIETFDPKPLLRERNGQELPDSVRKGQRLTGMSGNQSSLPLAGSHFKTIKAGKRGTEICELFPHTAKVFDDVCLVRSVTTEAINHDPAITFFQTGHQLAGRPSMGAWLSYGLGSANENLPGFIVLVSKDKTEQGLYARLWGNGFLPSLHQGVQFRSGADPVLYLANPDGSTPESRKPMLDALKELHRIESAKLGDPEIASRVAQYEMAYRMQTSVPDVMNLSREPMSVLNLYGKDVLRPGSFAANCLLARRLAERNVRFIQLYHPGWDHHGGLPGGIRRQAQEIDQPCAGLIQDLKRTGLLDDTLVIWGGEFGRTSYSQGKLTANDYGRDHHPRCFNMWFAGGGIKAGTVYGKTDDFGYNVSENPVNVHDIQATILSLLGIDHERLTYKFQGRYYRLTDIEGRIIKEICA